MTRAERAMLVRNRHLQQLLPNEQRFVEYVLNVYESEGEKELSQENLSSLIRLKYRTMKDAQREIGTADKIVHEYLDLQKELYGDTNR